jgi:hypothetical protein
MSRIAARLERAVLGALISLVVTAVERRLRRGLAQQRRPAPSHIRIMML